MTYFTQPICKILEEKGVVSDSGFWWCSDNDKNYILTNDPVKIVGDFHPDIEDYIYTYQAHTHLDIFNPDNARKLFGDVKVRTYLCSGCNTGEVQRRHESCQCHYDFSYRVSCHKLLNTMLSGGDVEVELIKFME